MTSSPTPDAPRPIGVASSTFQTMTGGALLNVPGIHPDPDCCFIVLNDEPWSDKTQSWHGRFVHSDLKCQITPSQADACIHVGEHVSSSNLLPYLGRFVKVTLHTGEFHGKVTQIKHRRMSLHLLSQKGEGAIDYVVPDAIIIGGEEVSVDQITGLTEVRHHTSRDKGARP